jgi:hypothetical protein
LEVEHGYVGYALQSFQIVVPQGVKNVNPIVKDGFSISIVSRTLPMENWFTDTDSGRGNVTTVANTVTWTATLGTIVGATVSAEADVDVFEIQLTTGCSFSDQSTNSFWNNNYTLWFPTTEVLVAINASFDPPTRQILWTGIVDGNKLWNDAKPSPAPYLYINDWSSCEAFKWFDENVVMPTKSACVDTQTFAALKQTVVDLQVGQTSDHRLASVSLVLAVLGIFCGFISAFVTVRMSLREHVHKV